MTNIGPPPPKEPTIPSFGFPWPFPERPHSLLYRIQSNLTLFGVFCFTKFVFCGLNRLKISPEEKKLFLALVEDDSRPLLTISNHRCVVDDPLVWALFTFREFFRNISRFRYTLAAHDICFTTALHTRFFALGRCVPCVRGCGVFQKGVDQCIEVLSNNGWVHMFPEGKVTPHPIRIKWGIARMIAESRVAPILLPIWTRGMQDVWTDRKPYRPRFGKTVEVFVGNPVDTAHWLSPASPSTPTGENGRKVEETELERRKRLADLVQAELFGLGKRVEEMAMEAGRR